MKATIYFSSHIAGLHFRLRQPAPGVWHLLEAGVGRAHEEEGTQDEKGRSLAELGLQVCLYRPKWVHPWAAVIGSSLHPHPSTFTTYALTVTIGCQDLIAATIWEQSPTQLL